MTKNYHAHGGDEWVVGGKLTFLPGATVEGAEGLFDFPQEGQAPVVQDCEATTVPQLREYINGVLATLRNAGIIAPPPKEEKGD